MAATKFFADQTTPLVIKAAQQSVINSVTLVADNHLTFPVLANASYRVRLMLAVQGSAAAGGFKAGFNIPAGLLMQGLWISGAVNNSVTIQNSNASVNIITAANMKTRQIVLGEFYVNVAATGGNLTLTWAQVTANALATFISSLSTLEVTRLA